MSESQIGELTRAYAQHKDGPTRARFQAVRLYGLGYPVAQIKDITGCSASRLLEWCAAFCKEGSAALLDQRRGGNRAKLSPAQLADLKDRLRVYTPADLFGAAAATADGQFWSVPDLERALAQWYGVRYQRASSYRRCLAQAGFSYQRPAQVYKSRKESQTLEFEAQLEKN